MSDASISILDPGGQINTNVSAALRNARNQKQIKGYSMAVVIAAIGLYEVALDRDRAFDEADTEKYNAWFDEHLKNAGISLTKQDDKIVVSQNQNPTETLDVFNALPELKKQLFVSIENSFESKIDKDPNGELMTRRKSFSAEEKSQQMDQYIIASANHEDIEYDPATETFSKY